MTVPLPLAFATDHAGVSLKPQLLDALRTLGHTVLDVGAQQADPADDYPDHAKTLATAITGGQAEKGLLLCGSGVGVSMAANRIPGIRAALCHDMTTARLARLDNDANVLCLGARTMGLVTMLDIIRVFFQTDFSNVERHRRRIAKLG